jgi:DNA-binding XRE family transcriptional regulator
LLGLYLYLYREFPYICGLLTFMAKTSKKKAYRVQNIRNEKFLTAFGDKVREIRIKKEYSQEKLASLAKLSRTQIANIELAKLGCNLNTIYLLSKGLGIDHRELMDFDY